MSVGPTPPGWATLAAERLPTFLADHAVCEQALNMVAHYPEDA
jgi:tRNA isopentenyl-2-thiomethyl-A-37 hydroxylase MiaE